MKFYQVLGRGPISRVVVLTMQSLSSGRMSAGVSPTGRRYLEMDSWYLINIWRQRETSSLLLS